MFVNQLSKRDTLQKAYVVRYMAVADKRKENFVPFELPEDLPANDKKLINRIFKKGLKQNDTVSLIFDKGLFGLPFQSRPFKVE